MPNERVEVDQDRTERVEMSGRLLQWLSTLLVIAGLAMLAIAGHHWLSSASGQRQGLEAFEAARQARQAQETANADTSPLAVANPQLPPLETAEGRPRGAAPNTSGWSESRKRSYDGLSNAAGLLPEGILRLPAVRLEVPVFAGTGEFALTRGAGRIEGTPVLGESGNTGIAAHRDGWFRALKDVRVGDAVEVETLQGAYRFRITQTFVVEPADVQVLAPTGQNSLTLVTCYPFFFVGSAPQRYIVRAVRS